MVSTSQRAKREGIYVATKKKKAVRSYAPVAGWPKKDPFTQRMICEKCWNRDHHNPNALAPPESFCNCGCIENNVADKKAAKERAAAAAVNATEFKV